jgi:hypothetical protein
MGSSAGETSKDRGKQKTGRKSRARGDLGAVLGDGSGAGGLVGGGRRRHGVRV